MIENKIIGPLFVVGMPRSGTKLLRSLLNEHSQIAIPDIETEFLPHWVKNWEKFGDLSILQNFRRFYQKIIKQPYFIYQESKSRLIDCDVWFSLCSTYTVSDVFESLIRHDINLTPESEIIWGDKSPAYLPYIDLIKNLYPSAKVIHIIRDVRDYCLSMKKTWGKNMFRAAQRWNNDIDKAQKQGRKIGSDYIELKYEDLLDDPAKQCKRLCQFLELDFESSMLNLSVVPEDLGDAKGLRKVLKKNKNKYINSINPKALRKIELITYDKLKSLGYSVKDYNRDQKKLGLLEMNYYKLLDGFQLFRFRLKKRGFFGSIRFIMAYVKISDIKYKDQ